MPPHSYATCLRLHPNLRCRKRHSGLFPTCPRPQPRVRAVARTPSRLRMPPCPHPRNEANTMRIFTRQARAKHAYLNARAARRGGAGGRTVARARERRAACPTIELPHPAETTRKAGRVGARHPAAYHANTQTEPHEYNRGARGRARARAASARLVQHSFQNITARKARAGGRTTRCAASNTQTEAHLHNNNNTLRPAAARAPHPSPCIASLARCVPGVADTCQTHYRT